MLNITTSFNGVNLDNTISGFHTLSVNGRQFPGVSATTKENAGDGATFLSKRFTSKVIEVSFMIKAENRADMQDKQNHLLTLLKSEPAQLVFSDEPNLYYTAYFSGSSLENTYTARSGVIQFTCCDPFKHSTTLKEFTATEQTDGTQKIVIQNSGNVAVPIDYEITTNTENGYIGIVSTEGAMEFGDIEEADKIVGNDSQTLLNLASGTQINSAFNGNAAITTGTFSQNGTFAIEGEWLKLSNKGSGSSWHGAGGQITIPADINSETGSKNFKVVFKPWYATHQTYVVTGDMEIVVGDENGDLLCDVHLVKSSTGNNTAGIRFKIAGQGDKFASNYEPRSDKGITRENGNEVWFSKSGELFTVCWDGKTHEYRVPELKDKKAYTVNVFIGCSKTTNPVTYMRLKYLKFIKNDVEYDYDVPNRYQPGDVLTVDGNEGKFYVNGNAQLQDEVIGTEYFKAVPGQNEVIVSASSFCATKPTVKAYIREAWL